MANRRFTGEWQDTSDLTTAEVAAYLQSRQSKGWPSSIGIHPEGRFDEAKKRKKPHHYRCVDGAFRRGRDETRVAA